MGTAPVVRFDPSVPFKKGERALQRVSRNAECVGQNSLRRQPSVLVVSARDSPPQFGRNPFVFRSAMAGNGL